MYDCVKNLLPLIQVKRLQFKGLNYAALCQPGEIINGGLDVLDIATAFPRHDERIKKQNKEIKREGGVDVLHRVSS